MSTEFILLLLIEPHGREPGLIWHMQRWNAVVLYYLTNTDMGWCKFDIQMELLVNYFLLDVYKIRLGIEKWFFIIEIGIYIIICT